MGQEMNSVLPVLLILIFTLDQDTFLPESQYDEDHEENDEEHRDHEENDDEHGDHEETDEDCDCCPHQVSHNPHLQPISSQTLTYEDKKETMKEEDKTTLDITENIDMDDEPAENK